VLEEIDVDAERGISSPSTASRVRGEVGRTVDDVRERVSGIVDGGDTDRAQLQIGSQGRGTGETDFGDAPDRTRPADAGGTFEDVRDDALTQIQDDLGGRASRPDPGDFERAPQPFRDRGGDTIDADAGVQLERSTTTPDLDVGSVEDASGFGVAGTASATGLGVLSGVNDPTDIAGTEAVTGAQSRADSRSDSDAGAFGRLGVLAGVNDPTQIAPSSDTETGTDIGTELGTDTAAGVGTDTVAETDTSGLGDSDTREEPLVELRGTTTVGTQQSPGTITVTGAATRTVADPTVATDIGADAAPAGRGVGLGGDTPTRRAPRGEESEEDDELPPRFGLAADADVLDSGIASGDELVDDIGDGFRL